MTVGGGFGFSGLKRLHCGIKTAHSFLPMTDWIDLQTESATVAFKDLPAFLFQPAVRIQTCQGQGYGNCSCKVVHASKNRKAQPTLCTRMPFPAMERLAVSGTTARAPARHDRFSGLSPNML